MGDLGDYENLLNAILDRPEMKEYRRKVGERLFRQLTKYWRSYELGASVLPPAIEPSSDAPREPLRGRAIDGSWPYQIEGAEETMPSSDAPGLDLRPRCHICSQEVAIGDLVHDLPGDGGDGTYYSLPYAHRECAKNPAEIPASSDAPGLEPDDHG